MKDYHSLRYFSICLLFSCVEINEKEACGAVEFNQSIKDFVDSKIANISEENKSTK